MVLGGTGFLGRKVCQALTDGGFEVVRVARRATGRPGGAAGVAVDLAGTAPADLAGILDGLGPGVIVNAAGAVWAASGEQLFTGNVVLVRRVLDALRLMRSRPRFVHIGSVNEYAPQPVGRSVYETTPTVPATTYGRVKLLGSQAVLDGIRTMRLDGTVLRMANLVGPGSPPQSLLGRVAHGLRDAARNGETATIRLTPLRARRDFVDVSDAATAVVRAAVREVAPDDHVGRLLNIGSGNAVEVRLAVRRLIELSGVPARVEEQPDPASGALRGPDWLQVDVGAAARYLGWQPVRSLDSSLSRLWADVSVRDTDQAVSRRSAPGSA